MCQDLGYGCGQNSYDDDNFGLPFIMEALCYHKEMLVSETGALTSGPAISLAL